MVDGSWVPGGLGHEVAIGADHGHDRRDRQDDGEQDVQDPDVALVRRRQIAPEHQVDHDHRAAEHRQQADALEHLSGAFEVRFNIDRPAEREQDAEPQQHQCGRGSVAEETADDGDEIGTNSGGSHGVFSRLY